MMLLSLMVAKAQGGMEQTAAQIAARMGVGWNLGNTLEAGDKANSFTNKGGLAAETAWQGTQTTQQVIDYVKSLGFKSVRIPCAWVMGHISDVADYTIDPAWMARVKQVTDFCIKAGLYVVINQHWDSGWLENNIAADSLKERNKEVLRKVWTQIATTFRDYDEHLLLAGLNEPNADTQAAVDNLLEYEQVFVDAVRATGGNNARRILIIQGPGTDINKTDQFFNTLPNDPAGEGRLMMEVHYYNPWQFWGMEKDEDWGNVFYYWGSGNHVEGSKHNATWGEEADLRSQLQKMKTKFGDKGIPVYIGEFGANWRIVSGEGESQEKHDASIKAHYKAFCQTALEMGMVPVIWDINYCNRPSMTLIDRSNLKVYNTLMMDGIREAMRK